MRELKFRAWDGTSMEIINDLYWFEEVGVHDSSGYGHHVKYKIMQFTGLKDKYGVDIYEGDILNICYTSGGGDHIHDCVYEAEFGTTGGLEFNFIGLLWYSYGFNQYPISLTLCDKYRSIDSIYDGRLFLTVGDQYSRDPEEVRRFPFNEEKVMSFNSRYFEVIGNIHETPEIIDDALKLRRRLSSR